MKDAGEMTVVMLSEKAWERQEIIPVTNPIPVSEWLGIIQERGMMVLAPPFSRISEGPYDGGHVLALDDEDGRSWFAVPAAVLPMLRSYMSPQMYEDLVRRTPKLQRAR